MTMVFRVAQFHTAEAVKAIRSGLPASCLIELACAFDLTTGALAKKLGMPARLRGRLTPVESEKVLRAARIWNAARELFTCNEPVARWLKRQDLSGAAPIDWLDTDVGSAAVEQLIRAIGYGNFL